MWGCLPDFYAENLRSILFTGLLTIGTFVFAVKTFIIIKLKEDVFDTEYYRERVEKNRRLGCKSREHYGQLKNLTTILFLASVLSLSSAILQVTLGFVPYWWSAVICMASAALSITMLFWSPIIVKMNLNVWLADLEAQQKKKAN